MSNNSPAPTSSRSVYGFALYLTSYTLLLLYLIWAYIPTPWLHALGLTYWPHKYWAIAVPVIVGCCIFIFAVFLYPGITLFMASPLLSVNTIYDSHSRTKREFVPGCVPPIYDIPLTEINHILYSRKVKR